MIKEELFEALKENIENFDYTSMKYTDYETVSDYEIIRNDDKLILLVGNNDKNECKEYHFAGSSAEELLNSIDKTSKSYLSFVPREWVELFKQNSFEVYALFNDYHNSDISHIEAEEEPELLTENECEAAALVTQSCRGQSRGFHGETHEWMKSWISGEEASAGETKARNCAVLIHRENDAIVGVLCTATYAHESIKGPIVWIREVAVNPSYQRRGIARKLILQALKYGKVHGATRAFLAADECNDHAIRLYEHLGFVGKKEEAQIDMILLS